MFIYGRHLFQIVYNLMSLFLLGIKDINVRMSTLGYELVEIKQNGHVCDVLFIKKSCYIK